MKATVHVFLKPGVLDVQGKAVESALHGLGWSDVGVTGSKADCLAYIATVWTDPRPRSLREWMAANQQ